MRTLRGRAIETSHLINSTKKNVSPTKSKRSFAPSKTRKRKPSQVQSEKQPLKPTGNEQKIQQKLRGRAIETSPVKNSTKRKVSPMKSTPSIDPSKTRKRSKTSQVQTEKQPLEPTGNEQKRQQKLRGRAVETSPLINCTKRKRSLIQSTSTSRPSKTQKTSRLNHLRTQKQPLETTGTEDLCNSTIMDPMSCDPPAREQQAPDIVIEEPLDPVRIGERFAISGSDVSSPICSSTITESEREGMDPIPSNALASFAKAILDDMQQAPEIVTEEPSKPERTEERFSISDSDVSSPICSSTIIEPASERKDPKPSNALASFAKAILDDMQQAPEIVTEEPSKPERTEERFSISDSDVSSPICSSTIIEPASERKDPKPCIALASFSKAIQDDMQQAPEIVTEKPSKPERIEERFSISDSDVSKDPISASKNSLQDDMQQISVTEQAPPNMESEKTQDFQEESYEPWRILGYLDAMATESLIDNCFVKSHKLCVLENAPELLKNERHQKLYNIIYRSYLESTEFVKYVPTPMYGDNCVYTQMAVVAVDTIKKGKQIGGLSGFTAVMWENDLTPEMEFSVFKVQNNSEKAKIMLGPASFVNHDCNPNCR